MCCPFSFSFKTRKTSYFGLFELFIFANANANANNNNIWPWPGIEGIARCREVGASGVRAYADADGV